MRDELEVRERVYLEKLRLAVSVILDLGEDPGVLPDTFQSELFIFRDRVERALLMIPGTAIGALPREPGERR